MTDIRIRPANRSDVAGLTALEARYYIGNLEPDRRADGFISTLHSPDWFERLVDIGAVYVAATENEEVVGFMVVEPPPDPGQQGLPAVVKEMLNLTKTLEVNGKPIARQRFAVHGPVCIAEEARGRGLYAALHAATTEAYRGRFDVGVLFVAADNPRSLHTTTTKLGAQSLAVYIADGRQFHFLAFPFGGGVG